MKIIKLSVTVREDVETARMRALPLNREDYPPDGILDDDEYQDFVNGSPRVVQATGKLLTDTSFWEKSAIEPIIIEHNHYFSQTFRKHFKDTLLLYQNCLYEVRGHLTDDQRRLLVLEAADKERQLFERLKAKFVSPAGAGAVPARHRIPEAVRIAVWKRDQGRCATPDCGSRRNLEYDHIIPIDAGGSNTVRNVELLCETCNRRKSNNIQ